MTRVIRIEGVVGQYSQRCLGSILVNGKCIRGEYGFAIEHVTAFQRLKLEPPPLCQLSRAPPESPLPGAVHVRSPPIMRARARDIRIVLLVTPAVFQADCHGNDAFFP